MALQIELQPELSSEIFLKALDHVLERHDVFRLSYTKVSDRWMQNCAKAAPGVKCRHADLKGLMGEAQRAAIHRLVLEQAGSLDLSHAPLFSVAHIELPTPQKARMLLVLHHLMADGVSLVILMDELSEACKQLLNGTAVDLPASTTPFSEFARCLARQAAASMFDPEILYWQSLPWNKIKALPLDHNLGPNTYGRSDTVVRALQANALQELRHWSSECQISIEVLLLSALARVLSRWAKADHVLIDLTAHGRDMVLPGVSLSRTVGYLTCNVPVIVPVADTHELGPPCQACAAPGPRDAQWRRGFWGTSLLMLGCRGPAPIRGPADFPGEVQLPGDHHFT